MKKTHDAVLIGNAIVDIISRVSEERLAELKVSKSLMTLVDAERSAALFAEKTDAVQTAGGSAANTAVVMVELGTQAKYISKIANDDMGDFYAADLQKRGVDYDTARGEGMPTGTSMIFVTPDGERSMNTHLGITTTLETEDYDFDAIWNARYLYLEGYLFTNPQSPAAFKTAIERARANDTVVALTLSDPFVVEENRDALRDLISHGVNLVFCNEAELIAYTRTSDIAAALEAVRHNSERYAVTAGAAGAYIVLHGEITHIPTQAVKVIDATGAGDYFAGAFLAALTKGMTYKEAAIAGNRAAGAIVQVMGTRVNGDLKQIVMG